MKIGTNFLVIFILALGCSGSFIHAQQNITNKDSHVIPFTLTAHNNISIEAILNNSDTVQLMLHTAANSMTLTTEVTSSLSNINWNSESDVNTWGGQATARFSEYNSLEIAGLKWDSLEIWETDNSGPGTDGKIGPNLFDGNVLEIDFETNELRLHSKLPAKVDEYQKLPLLFENDFMFIEGTSEIGGRTYQTKFLIHSGYGGALLYDDKFTSESKIGEQIEIISEQELKDSYGNVLKTKKGVLPKFCLGDLMLTNIPVGFFEGTIGRQQMSVLGGDVLKRFSIIIDEKKEFIYLKSNNLSEIAFTEF